MTYERLLDIALQFEVEVEIVAIEALGEGFINDTYVVTTAGDAPNYILQRKNHVVFPDVPGMMQNIKAVTEHIKAKVADPMRETLTVIPAKDGELYVKDGENYWAVCLYIPDTVTFDRADSCELAYHSLWKFQTQRIVNLPISGFSLHVPRVWLVRR